MRLIMTCANIAIKERFGQRLRIARKLSGLSLGELSVAAGCSVTRQGLSKYELGEMMPREATLIEICRALALPRDYFLADTKGFDLPELRIGSGCELSVEVMEEISTTIEFYTKRFRLKREKLGLEDGFSCSLLKRQVSDIEDISAVADALRAEWACGDGPIASVLRLLERHGIWVFSTSLPDAIYGLSTWVDSKFPIMLLDMREDKTSVERLRFTAAHELAHLLLSFPKGAKVEKMCNRFASYFLLPQKTLVQELGSCREALYLEELIDLHEYYGVSIAALVHEAYDFGIISREHYDYWYDTNIKANPKETGWGKYLFPETLGKEKRMDIILAQ